MAEESKERPDSAAGPVFVDSSGGRRRRWRRLGLAMGAIGGGYALIVAVSVIGGNSEAPWGVLIPGADDGASRVVPDRDGSTKAPWADGARLGEPGAYASTESSAPQGNGARTPPTSPEPSPPAPASSGAAAPEAKGSSSGKAGRGKSNEGATSAGSGSASGTGGSGSSGGSGPADPSTDPASGGATGSTGTPTPPPPSESPDSDSSAGDGFLSGILAGFSGAPGSTTAAGAE